MDGYIKGNYSLYVRVGAGVRWRQQQASEAQ